MPSCLTIIILVFTQCIHRYYGSYYRYQHEKDDGWIDINEDDRLDEFIEDWHNDDLWDKQKSVTIDDDHVIRMKCFSAYNEETCACRSGARQPIYECYDHSSLGIY